MKATFRYLSFCKVIILIQITILILNSCTCDRIDNRKIKVINESMSDIVWLKSSNKAFRKPKYNQDIDSVSIDSIGYISNIVPTWNELIEESKDKKIAIFIINNDSLKKYGWETIYKKNNFSKVYLLNIEDLNNCQWEIRYDGK